MFIFIIAIIYCLIGGIFLYFLGEKGVTGLNLFSFFCWPLIGIIYIIAICFANAYSEYDDFEK